MKIDLALMEQFVALGIGSAPVTGDQVSGEFAALLSQLIASDSVLNSESAGLADGENAENLAEMLLAELGGKLPANDQFEADKDKAANTPIIQALNGQLILVADVKPKEGFTGVPLPPEASDVAAAKIEASAFIDNEKAGGKNAEQNAAAGKVVDKTEGKGLFEQTAQSVKNEILAGDKALSMPDAEKAVPEKANAVPVDPKTVPEAEKALNEQKPADFRSFVESSAKQADLFANEKASAGGDKALNDPKAAPGAEKAVPEKASAAHADPKVVPEAAKALNEQKPADFRSFTESSAKQANPTAKDAASAIPEQQATGSADSSQKAVDSLFRSENGATRVQVSTTASEQPVLGQQPSIQGDHGVRAESVLQSQQNPNLRESVLQQLEGRMIYLRETGNNPAEMRMILHPPELGEVTIRVFSKQGVLSASIIAETTLVKEILESSISELRQRLNFVEIQFEQLDLSTSGKQSGESDRPARNFNPDELAQLGLDRPEHRADEGVNDPLRASSSGETMGVDYFA